MARRFYLRKAVPLGKALRFNVSLGGIGRSIGFRGFRLGRTPGGEPYIHAGISPVYYRARLGRGGRSFGLLRGLLWLIAAAAVLIAAFGR